MVLFVVGGAGAGGGALSGNTTPFSVCWAGFGNITRRRRAQDAAALLCHRAFTIPVGVHVCVCDCHRFIARAVWARTKLDAVPPVHQLLRRRTNASDPPGMFMVMQSLLLKRSAADRKAISRRWETAHVSGAACGLV